MILKFCDCCEEEVHKERDFYKFSYFVHLLHMHDVRGYSDSNGNRVSGRTETLELCISCYNRIVIEAVNKFQELKLQKEAQKEEVLEQMMQNKEEVLEQMMQNKEVLMKKL